jgi:NADH dehydrogenase [ubiquinone] 1 alpha subcomplex assembly factor 7
MELTEQIADRISSDGGGALIIDYGKNGIVSDSLQVCILKPFHYIRRKLSVLLTV